jgi:hypothetical protein
MDDSISVNLDNRTQWAIRAHSASKPVLVEELEIEEAGIFPVGDVS